MVSISERPLNTRSIPQHTASSRRLVRECWRGTPANTTALTRHPPRFRGVTRHYDDFDAFAEEGGFARILGGMHFRNSVEVGHREGKSVANWILGHCLTPLDDDGER